MKIKKSHAGHKTSLIEGEIKSLIKKGDFNASAPIWTEKKLCEHFDASRVTVRRSIENLTGQGILYRLKGKGTYVSPGMKRQKQKSFILMLTVAYDNYFGGIAKGALDAAASAGYQAILKITDNKGRESEKKILENIPFNEIDGMIISPIHSYFKGDDFYLKLSEKVRNIVYVNCLPPLPENSDKDIVVCDDFECAKLATNHLISLGHKKIAHLAGCFRLSNAFDRLNGYRKALEEAGIKFREDMVVACDYNTEKGHDEALKILSSPKKRPTAIFCASDSTAVGVYEAAFELGIKIPDELSVVGFCNNHTVFPGLTTVDLNSPRIGQEAFKLLKDKIDGRETTGKKIILPGKLVIRNSCANI